MASVKKKTVKKRADEATSDEVWLAAAVNDGRARLEPELSMKALGTPDFKLQQRVDHLDVNHVRRLDRMRREGVVMYPVVVFYDPVKKKYYLADGFHRWKMTLNAGLDWIRAYVIEGTWRDAMIYSTMCNQMAIKQRSSEDIKKAVFTLLSDEEWWGKSDTLIGKHCGVCCGTVMKYRAEYCKSRDISLPETVKDTVGRTTPYKRSNGNPRLLGRSVDGKSQQFRASIKGKLVHLGTNEAKAREQLDVLVSEQEQRKATLTPRAIRTRLERQGLVLEGASLGLATNSGLSSISMCCGVIFVVEELSRDGSGRYSPAVPTAVGRVLLARQMVDPTARAVVVCYTEDAPPELIEAGRAIGVEFLTPEELVDSLKGDADPASNGAEEQ